MDHRHETIIHVQLLVAVKESRAGIVRREIHLDLLSGGHNDHVFHECLPCFASELR
jgi:hypothetical protein